MAKIKFYHLNADAVDTDGVKHNVTVVGKFEQRYIRKPITQAATVEVAGKSVEGKLTYSKRTLERTLTIGIAICNPNDTFNAEEGIKLAKKRIAEGKDLGKITTNDVTMLTKDLIVAEMLGKLTYITANVDKYIKRKH